MKKPDYPEVWRKIEVESKLYNHKVSNHGRVMKTSKKLWRESLVSRYEKSGKVVVKVAQKEYCVKHLVAEAFIFSYKKGMSVTHKDGNPKNCSVDNLLVLSKQELGKLTGIDHRRNISVIANGVEYYSIRDCAKALHCSHQTVRDYMVGKNKSSVLDGIEIRRVE